ncbi:phage tail fiber protein [Acinetobacter bereziniae]|uniref:phage tail fiber protein n=1 Tax=Acinetobacter bereziniae TaxID=106648 RepID=UPI001901C3F9|nr:hypothetical protein [Acinetobacter bereziniae]MBJ8426058.1 hypothetical protein [Acinetobacter bereziniae]
MAVNKLPEFAQNGQKNTDGLTLEDGFPVNLKPARQWFNFLFNKLALSINQIIDEKAALSGATFTGEVVSTSSNSFRIKDSKRGVFWRLDENNLYLMKTPDNSPDAGWDETRPIMWEFKTNKLFLGSDVEFATAKGNLTGNASTASKLQIARTVQFDGAATGSFSYDGSGNSSCLLTLANSGVVAGSYASTIQIPQISVNAKGQITSISQQNIRNASVTQSGVVQLSDDLVTDDPAKALSSKQGKILQDEKAALSGATFTGEVVSTSSNSYRLKNAKRSIFWRLDENNLYLMKTPDNSPDGGWDESRPIMWEFKTNKLFLGSDVEFQAVVKGNLTGNADTASKFQTSRNIALSGAVSGNADFDGSGNIIINAALNNFSSYKAENGYKYLGDGTILQWGRIDSDATEKNVTVTFPITFPNGCLNISMTRLSAYSTSATSEADGDALVVEGTITNYSFVANLQRFNTSTSMLRGAMWFAIGH